MAAAENKKMRLVPHFEKLMGLLAHRISAIGKLSSSLTYCRDFAGSDAGSKSSGSHTASAPLGPDTDGAISVDTCDTGETCEAPEITAYAASGNADTDREEARTSALPVIFPDPAGYQVCSFEESIRRSISAVPDWVDI